MGRNQPSEKPTPYPRSNCAVACTLDILGDKWTLLVVRDLLLGKTKFNEFLESSESIPTNLLADRLKRLQEQGLVTKELYQKHPPRSAYQLTEKGRALGPLMMELVRWGKTHLKGTRVAKKLRP